MHEYGADPAAAIVERYFSRLRTVPPAQIDAQVLGDLHRAHLENIAFENLDIHLGRPIELEPDAVLAKLLRAGRGGFCYELNSAFAWLLRTRGVDVDMLQAQVYDPDGTLAPPFDHLVLRVTIDGEPHLADVGFGDNFVCPLRLDHAGPQADPAGAFELRPVEDESGADVWDLIRDGRPAYRLDGRARSIDAFVPMSTFQQTSPESHFTQGTVCTRLTVAGGRVTIADSNLIVTSPGGTRDKHRLDRPALEAAYAEHFGYPSRVVPPAAPDADLRSSTVG